MLAIDAAAAAPGRLCDGVSRRELLTVGGLGLLGFGLPDLFRTQAQAAAVAPAHGGGRAKSVILLYLQGSPSHIDLWDPKPDAPVEIRGEFSPIATSVPGLFVGEVLPLLARQAHRFALVRSVGVKPRGLANHGASIYMLMTAHDPLNFSPTGLAVPPSRDDLPSIGSLAARYKPGTAGALSYVALSGPIREGSVTGVGQFAGLLGGMYHPYQMYDDPSAPLRAAPRRRVRTPRRRSLGRLRARMALRTALLAGERPAPSAASASPLPTSTPGAPPSTVGDFDGYYGKALSLIASGKAVAAFRLDDEPAPLRERFGATRFGQSCLLARRLVEAGTRFVQVNWPSGSDTEPAPGPDGSWDTHRNNFPMLRDWRCPVFDRAASALLEDLAERGLLDETLVLMIGEFGRSPKIGASTTNNVGPGGRDHWPSCYSCLIAGGGVRGGQAYGESDRHGAYPNAQAVHPYDVVATLFYALGIDHAAEYRDTLDRPRRLVEHGGPIVGLF